MADHEALGVCVLKPSLGSNWCYHDQMSCRCWYLRHRKCGNGDLSPLSVWIKVSWWSCCQVGVLVEVEAWILVTELNRRAEGLGGVRAALGSSWTEGCNRNQKWEASWAEAGIYMDQAATPDLAWPPAAASHLCQLILQLIVSRLCGVVGVGVMMLVHDAWCGVIQGTWLQRKCPFLTLTNEPKREIREQE